MIISFFHSHYPPFSHGQSEILEAGLHDTTAATATATGAATERRPGSSAVSTATATGAMAARSDLLLRQKSSFSHSSLTRTGTVQYSTVGVGVGVFHSYLVTDF